MISLRASPINRPPVGAQAEAGRQVPGLSQPPDRPSRQPIPACRRRPRRLLLPQLVTLPTRGREETQWVRSERVSKRLRSPGRAQGLGGCILQQPLFVPPGGPPSSAWLSTLTDPQRGFVAEGPPCAYETPGLVLWESQEKGDRGLLRWRNSASLFESNH